jgi:hypothetical protein
VPRPCENAGLTINPAWIQLALPEPALVAIMIAIAVAVAVAVVAEIAVTVAVPPVIVIKPAVVAIPISREELSSFISRPHPYGAGVWWPAPIPVMPLVVVSNRVPITVHPEVIRSGRARSRAYNARWRRRSNSHADGQLRKTCTPGNQK